MNTLHASFTTAAALMTSSLAFAHGASEGSTLYHYMSSPDHVVTFFVLAISALGASAWLMRRSVATARQKKRL